MVTIFGLLCKSDCKSNIDFLLFEVPVLENGMSNYLEENTQQCQLNVSSITQKYEYHKIQIDRIYHEKCYFRTFIALQGTINLVFDVSISDQCTEY